MKYALIGCGRIAVNHIKACVENNIEIIALCDIDNSAIDNLILRSNLKESNSIKRYHDYKKMIEENTDLDIIAIATDSGIHAEIALYCIDKGYNVIIEKPMAMCIKDANEIVKKARENKVKVSVCHQNRFNIAIQELRKAILDDRFGKLSHGSINVRWNRGLDYYKQAKWRGKWESDGGCLFNQCIHGIDLLCWMFDYNVDEIYGVTRKRFHDYIQCEDVGAAIIKFKNGSIGTIEGTVNVYPKNLEETLYIFGEKGTVKIGGTSTNNIDVWDFSDENSIDVANKSIKEFTSNVYGNGHTSLYKDFIDSINQDKEPYITALDGRNAVEIILAIYESSFSGKSVKLPLSNVSSIDFVGRFD